MEFPTNEDWSSGDWRALARCSGLTASFFPEPYTPLTTRLRTIAEAKAVCALCPVKGPCLDFALAHRIKDGVWGGLTEDGHPQCYVKKSDAQLRKEADRDRVKAEAALTAERDQRLAAERELKRQEKRAKAGVCPCCLRSFVQLARHMKTKHPEFAKAPGA